MSYEALQADSTPGGIFIANGTEIGFIVDMHGSAVSQPFPVFRDNITDECGVSGDCHQFLDYSFERYVCDDSASCLCTDSFDRSNVHNDCWVSTHKLSDTSGNRGVQNVGADDT